jgi:hypothetical protein
MVQVLHRCVSRQLHHRYVRLCGDCSVQKGIEASGNYAVHPRAGEHISHARLLRLIGKPSNPEERPPWPGALPLRKIDSFKHVLHSTKELYGCLASKADWCFVTDSETLLIRCVRLAELVAHYIAKGRTILHNPRYNPRQCTGQTPFKLTSVYGVASACGNAPAEPTCYFWAATGRASAG